MQKGLEYPNSSKLTFLPLIPQGMLEIATVSVRNTKELAKRDIYGFKC